MFQRNRRGHFTRLRAQRVEPVSKHLLSFSPTRSTRPPANGGSRSFSLDFTSIASIAPRGSLIEHRANRPKGVGSSQDLFALKTVESHIATYDACASGRCIKHTRACLYSSKGVELQQFTGSSNGVELQQFTGSSNGVEFQQFEVQQFKGSSNGVELQQFTDSSNGVELQQLSPGQDVTSTGLHHGTIYDAYPGGCTKHTRAGFPNGAKLASTR